MGGLQKVFQQVEDNPVQYLKTFLWGGALIASIQVLVDGGHGMWGAIIAAAPIKDILVVALTPPEDRKQAVNDMFLADASVVVASLVMMVAFNIYPDITVIGMGVGGLVAWLVASILTMRPPPFGKH